MRSPSRAPPPLRRVGSMARTATRSLSSWSSRKRRTSSSVSEDLPEPPVPVMPSTGAGWRPAAAGDELARPGVERARPRAAVITRARARWSPARAASTSAAVGRGQGSVALGDHGVDHGRQAHGLAVLGREDPGHPVALQVVDLVGHDGPAAPAVHPDVGPPGGPQPVDQVPEVLDVAALVGADGHPLHVLLDGRGHHLVHGPVVAQVDHLGPLGLQQPAHDVDGGVVAVEEAGRGDEPNGMDWTVQFLRHHPCHCSKSLDVQLLPPDRLDHHHGAQHLAPLHAGEGLLDPLQRRWSR